MKRGIEVERGQNLSKWRKVKGMTRNQLAKRAEISSVYLFQLEQGMKCGTPNTWIKLANALGIPLFTLIDFDRLSKVRQLREEASDKSLL